MGFPMDDGGYDTEQEVVTQAKRLNTRLQIIRKMGGIKPGISNDRAVALVLWLDGSENTTDCDKYASLAA